MCVRDLFKRCGVAVEHVVRLPTNDLQRLFENDAAADRDGAGESVGEGVDVSDPQAGNAEDAAAGPVARADLMEVDELWLWIAVIMWILLPVVSIAMQMTR